MDLIYGGAERSTSAGEGADQSMGELGDDDMLTRFSVVGDPGNAGRRRGGRPLASRLNLYATPLHDSGALAQVMNGARAQEGRWA